MKATQYVAREPDANGFIHYPETEHQVWNTLRDARCSFYYVAVRRQALKQLRELVGEPAFYRAELPPPLPTWRLPRVR